MRFHLAHLFFVCCIVATRFYDVSCWESYEMDLFDLVEDVNQNFYEVFGINQNSDGNEIRKAYRKLSLQWHPDKNPDKQSEAEIKFRQIVSIYEVLKDDVKRARYDQILEFGLPDWKQPIFYFRRVRKLSFNELAIAISIIISIGHYFVLWAQYFERKLTIEDRMDDVKKLLEKKQKKKKASAKLDEIDATLQEYYANLPSPKLKDTLPYRISMWFVAFAISLPSFLKNVVLSKSKQDADNDDDEQNEENARKRAEEEYQKRKAQKQQEAKRLARELNPTRIVQSDNATPVVSYDLANRPQTSAEASAEQSEQFLESNSGKEWTDKQKSDLIKAIVKFPAGSTNRWAKIGEFVGRSSNDCIQMERQMKTSITSTNHSNLNSSSWTGESATTKPKRTVNISEEPTTRFDESGSNEEAWSQEQQKCLERALKDIGKDVPNRWDQIAEQVPNKTKEDCILRYKQLCASIKNKK